MQLPVYKYHPDPLSTGSVMESSALCRCCGKPRGYIYTANVYSTTELVNEICPWCIADGSAAKKFNATFVDDFFLRKGKINESIILEVTQRTPGFHSWQSEIWLFHCNDACAFLGEASKDEVTSIVENNLVVVGGENIEKDAMNTIARQYAPKDSPAFYKFICLHCSQSLFAMDFM